MEELASPGELLISSAACASGLEDVKSHFCDASRVSGMKLNLCFGRGATRRVGFRRLGFVAARCLRSLCVKKSTRELPSYGRRFSASSTNSGLCELDGILELGPPWLRKDSVPLEAITDSCF